MTQTSTLRKFARGQSQALGPPGQNSPDQKGTRRLNINLPKHVFEDLEQLAQVSGRTMTEVVRLALGLAAVALDEHQNGNKLAIANPNGEILREVVLPR